jgi:putative sigma-54 modulation protein
VTVENLFRVGSVALAKPAGFKFQLQPTRAALWGRALSEEVGMQLNITFRRFEATESLKEYALEKVERLKKYLSRPEAAEVHLVLSLERHLHHADLTLYSHGRVVRGHDSSSDMYAAIDLAVERLERQLKRHRDKVRHHHDRVLVHHGSRLLDHHDGRHQETVEAPAPAPWVEATRVIRSQERLATLSVEDAVLQLELLDSEFLVFNNSGSSSVNVVYRRRDGHYGLIEAPGQHAEANAIASP